MNSYGGKLLVGIEDNGEIAGIEKDFETFNDRKNLDGWLQHFTNLIDDHIGKEFMTYTLIQKMKVGWAAHRFINSLGNYKDRGQKRVFS